MMYLIEKLCGIDHAKITNHVIAILYEQPYQKEIHIQLELASEYDTNIGHFTLRRLLRRLEKGKVLESQLSITSDGEADFFWYIAPDLVANLPKKT